MATGIAIGLVVGAGIALLFSPAKGAETRHALQRQMRRFRRRGRDAWTDLGDELSEARRRWTRRHARHARHAREARHAADPMTADNA